MNQQTNLSLKDTTPITCNECGHNVFDQKIMLRSVSRFVTGTAENAIVPMPIFACSKCGHVNKEFLPPQEDKVK